MDVKEHTNFRVGEGIKLGKWHRSTSAEPALLYFIKVI